MIETYFETLKARILGSQHHTNKCAETKDTNRNHVNYGAATALAQVMRDMGHVVEVPVYEDENGCLKIPHIVIDGKNYSY